MMVLVEGSDIEARDGRLLGFLLQEVLIHSQSKKYTPMPPMPIPDMMALATCRWGYNSSQQLLTHQLWIAVLF
jgi:hypothetical protein